MKMRLHFRYLKWRTIIHWFLKMWVTIHKVPSLNLVMT